MNINKILSDNELFKDLPEDAINKIAPMCVEVSFRVGETIINKGDKDRTLYIVPTGRVSLELELPNGIPVELDQAVSNEVFGEMSLVNESWRSAHAMALVDMYLLKISTDDLISLLNSDHDIGYLVMTNLSRVLTRRLIATNIHLLKAHK